MERCGVSPRTGKLYFSPVCSSNVLVVDPTTNQSATGVFPDFGGGAKWSGVTFTPTTGKLYFCPLDAVRVLIISPIDTCVLKNCSIGCENECGWQYEQQLCRTGATNDTLESNAGFGECPTLAPTPSLPTLAPSMIPTTSIHTFYPTIHPSSSPSTPKTVTSNPTTLPSASPPSASPIAHPTFKPTSAPTADTSATTIVANPTGVPTSNTSNNSESNGSSITTPMSVVVVVVVVLIVVAVIAIGVYVFRSRRTRQEVMKVETLQHYAQLTPTYALTPHVHPSRGSQEYNQLQSIC